MIGYVLRRVGTGVAVFLSVTALTFTLFFARGGERLAANFIGDDMDPSQIRARAESLGLLRPLHTQYLEWLGGFVRGDLGASFRTSQAVVDVLATRLPVTLSLVLVSIVLTMLVGIPLGVLAATRGGGIDRGLQLFTVAMQAIPGYWLALILAIVFGLMLQVIPATGFIPLNESLGGWFSSVIMPSVAVAMASTAFVAAQIRGSMLDVLRQDYIRTLRARGISPRSIIFKHALRNAAPPTLTALSLQVIALLGGTVIVERIFALPGLGSISVTAGQDGDVPVVLGAVAYMVVVIVLVNLVTDILNGWVNPKARIR